MKKNILVILCLGMVASKTLAGDLAVGSLRCEYKVAPLGIDEAQPRLTWLVESPKRGEKQTAYEVLVASTEEILKTGKTDLWDSGKVAGDETVNVAYGGAPLTSRAQCFWRVGVWDKDGHVTWSRPASWTMGLLQTNDWSAKYISFRDNSPVFKKTDQLYLPPAHQFRKDFEAAKKIKRATIYSTALGIYELQINGQRVGDAVFTPGWTDYRQRAYYNTFDVTSLVKSGDNAIGAWLADGWYSGYIGFGLLTGIGTEHIGRYTYGKTPAIMVQLEIEYTDGTRDTIPTDKSWRVTGEGPIREGDFLMGEVYDARKEILNWSKPGFDGSKWQEAILAEENGPAPATFYEYTNPTNGGGPKIEGRPIDLAFKAPPKLESFPGLPVRPIQEIKPIKVTSPTNGTYIFHLGQNFAGVVRLKVRGKAGTNVKLRFGEMLYPDGRLMTENLRKARAIDHYILRGDPAGETYTPRFTFHGFQYVEVTGYPGVPPADAITGIVLHSDTPLTSGFMCSDPVANRLFKNIVWTQRANFIDLPTDCPQRDERFGWMGDAQIYVGCATLNADVAAFYTKWLREVMESQRPSGTYPGYCPYPFQHGWDFGTAWCDAGVICPWTVWQAYGDTRIIKRCWPGMVKFLEWRKATSKDFLGVNHGNEWGDWLSFGGKTPLDYVDTVYFAYSTKLMADMALAIGKDQEAADYRELREHIKKAFIQKYVKQDGSLAVDTETAYALALYMDLMPGDLRAAAGKILANKIRHAETADSSGMTTGFLGTRPLLPVLSDVGQNDLALELFQSRKFPSWGYEVAQGATTIWEHWDSYTTAHGFNGVDGKQNASMNSFAHYSFGAVGEWMFKRLAGIDFDRPGYEHIVIHPLPPVADKDPLNQPINWVTAHYDSVRGRIDSGWKLDKGKFELNIRIPANTTATVYVPAASLDDVSEGGHTLAKAKGVKVIASEAGNVVLAVDSGEYRFVSKMP